MYWVGEKTNLQQMDKALKHATSKHTMFSHQVLTANEIKSACKKGHLNKSALSAHKKASKKALDEQNALLASIWADLKLPKSQALMCQTQLVKRKEGSLTSKRLQSARIDGKKNATGINFAYASRQTFLSTSKSKESGVGCATSAATNSAPAGTGWHAKLTYSKENPMPD